MRNHLIPLAFAIAAALATGLTGCGKDANSKPVAAAKTEAKDKANADKPDAKAVPEIIADPTIAAFADWVEGSVDLYSGNLPKAIEVFERGIALLPPGVDVPRRLDLMLSYSSAVGLVGDVARATACHEEWLRLTEPPGERFHRSYALWSMGIFAMAQGEHEIFKQGHAAEHVRGLKFAADAKGVDVVLFHLG